MSLSNYRCYSINIYLVVAAHVLSLEEIKRGLYRYIVRPNYF